MSHDFRDIDTGVKKWILTFKANGPDVRNPEYLTDIKAETVRRFLHDQKSKYLDLTDDNGNLKETIQKREIESLKLIAESERESNKGEKRWVCSYGTRHKMTDGRHTGADGKKEWSEIYCGCREKFGVSYFVLLEWCQKFKGIDHSHEITPSMQEEFLRTQSLSN